jgi:hypothetical protein
MGEGKGERLAAVVPATSETDTPCRFRVVSAVVMGRNPCRYSSATRGLLPTKLTISDRSAGTLGMATDKSKASPLVLADESTAGPFVTGGLLRLPANQVDAAVAAIAKVKTNRGISTDAEIHCSVLFHGDKRRKSSFNALSSDNCGELVVDCVNAMNELGGTWWGSWVDRDAYPTDLQLIEGQRFRVESKHLAGLVVYGALVCVQHHVGSEYQLAFDPDPTKIDWGLAQRMQATHFARTHPQAVKLPDAKIPLLEMADVAAYTVAQSLLADMDPNNRGARRFPAILKLMEMRSSRLAYTPWLNPSTWQVASIV